MVGKVCISEKNYDNATCQMEHELMHNCTTVDIRTECHKSIGNHSDSVTYRNNTATCHND